MSDPKTTPDGPPLAQVVQQFMQAMQRAARDMQPALRRVAEAARPLVELAQSPAGRAMIAAYEARERLGLLDTQACHCLCAANHPGSVCQGEVLSREVTHLRFGSAATGPVDVPMCPPCAAATRSAPAIR